MTRGSISPLAEGLIPFTLDLPGAPLVRQAEVHRFVYCEASRETGHPDREGELVAVDALWQSRELFLEQGDLDIAHWAHLPNPLTGRPQPQYRIGLPVGVRLGPRGRSIFVKGEIFSNLTPPPPDSTGEWAEKFWHSIAEQVPPNRWFPSVYGRIKDFELLDIEGQLTRKITAVEWVSLGFATRVVHAELPPLSTESFGPFAEDTVAKAVTASGGLRFSWDEFAKALTVGVPELDIAERTGAQALTPENVEKPIRKLTPELADAKHFAKARLELWKALSRGAIKPTQADIMRALKKMGYSADEAEKCARAFLTEALRRLKGRR